MRHLFPIVITCALGCAAHAPRGQTARDPLTVSLLVEGLRKGEVRPAALSPGGTLRTGDSFTVTAQVDRPAYLYVIRYARAGWSTLLYPKGPEVALLPGRPVRLPEDLGRRFVLDEEIGEEVLYVVAAPRPLQVADPSLCGVLRLRCGEAGPGRDDDPPPPPPEGLPPDKRGNELLVDRGGSGQLRIQADKNGVAVLRFSFRHDR